MFKKVWLKCHPPSVFSCLIDLLFIINSLIINRNFLTSHFFSVHQSTFEKASLARQPSFVLSPRLQRTLCEVFPSCPDAKVWKLEPLQSSSPTSTQEEVRRLQFYRSSAVLCVSPIRSPNEVFRLKHAGNCSVRGTKWRRLRGLRFVFGFVWFVCACPCRWNNLSITSKSPDAISDADISTQTRKKKNNRASYRQN